MTIDVVNPSTDSDQAHKASVTPNVLMRAWNRLLVTLVQEDAPEHEIVGEDDDLAHLGFGCTRRQGGACIRTEVPAPYAEVR